MALACGAGGSSRTVYAQVTASVEAGISDVLYDGFLASAAASISPTLRWEHPRGRGFLSARGTYLRFESGNQSLDGSATGSWFTPSRDIGAVKSAWPLAPAITRPLRASTTDS